ncbi:MAG: hypothetical protein LBS93_06095 [Synergistaceae bacterium]|nr:hypothetical protein [Synergistaceae bacterium]
MENGITELVFILDRSGSMEGLEGDTIGGYNAMLARQKSSSGEAVMTTVLFDDRYELLHDRANIKDVEPITERAYYARGGTALLDAVGRTISKIGNAQKHTSPKYRADKTVFVITTDGMENASREYSASKVRSMVERQKERYGWEFIFLGANIDAVATAEQFGIDADRAANYHADGVGTLLHHKVVSEAILNIRERGVMPKDWASRIDEDYRRRSRK